METEDAGGAYRMAFGGGGTAMSPNGPGQLEGHSAHGTFRAEVHHPWHPACGTTIDIQYREKRGGEEVFVCSIPHDAAVVVPAWMFDRAVCSRLTLGPPRAAVVALRKVRSIGRRDHIGEAAWVFWHGAVGGVRWQNDHVTLASSVSAP